MQKTQSQHAFIHWWNLDDHRLEEIFFIRNSARDALDYKVHHRDRPKRKIQNKIDSEYNSQTHMSQSRFAKQI